MNKKTIITLILAIVAAISTRAIDAKHFYSGTAVLKGRILNKPADEWNLLSAKFQFAGPPFATGVDKDGKIVPVSEINKYLE